MFINNKTVFATNLFKMEYEDPRKKISYPKKAHTSIHALNVINNLLIFYAPLISANVPPLKDDLSRIPRLQLLLYLIPDHLPHCRPVVGHILDALLLLVQTDKLLR
jgi:hypothetical protein